MRKMAYVWCVAVGAFLYIRCARGQEPIIADGVAAVVGDEAIFFSDVEAAFWQMEAQLGTDTMHSLAEGRWFLRCQSFIFLITEKLLAQAAIKDSIEISDEEVENELERRLSYFISVFGSAEELEKFYQKSLIEIKADLREELREQLLAHRKRQKLTSSVKVTPTEVIDFFRNIPPDSLPHIEAHYSVGILVKQVVPAQWQVELARQQADELLKKLTAGMSFEVLATLYSEDEQSALNGGLLPWKTFQEIDIAIRAYLPQADTGQIIGPVLTSEGWEIIKVEERRGSSFRLRRLLVKPKLTKANYHATYAFLDSIRTLILTGKLTFQEAARNYSDDENTRYAGGMLLNPQNAKPYIPASQLPAVLAEEIAKLNVGELSKPIPTALNGRDAYQLIWLRDVVPAHTLSLEQDWELIEQQALAYKQEQTLRQWLAKELQTNFVYVDDYFRTCPQLKQLKWIQ